MIIINAKVFDEQDGFVQRDIFIEGETFADAAGGQTLNAEGCYAIPGLIDTHTHASVAYDFSSTDEAGLQAMADYQLANGVTALCPTTMTLPEHQLEKACRVLSTHLSDSGADIVGIYLEGPFVSEKKLGAQNPEYVALPSPDMFRRLQQAAGGKVKVLSVAPEVEGGMQLIGELAKEVSITIAHTTADYGTAMQAFKLGANRVTHLFNAMPPFSHRDPGVIGAALDSPRSMVELICDGVHIHPTVVRATFKMFGDDRIILISDSMMATGLEDGEYELGGQPVSVHGSKAVITGTDTIAGSVTNLMQILRTLVGMGVPLYSAVKCATVNPAKSLGIFDERGSITPGKIADLVLLDDSLSIKHVIKHGKQVD